jgi:hypothetical protein
MQRWVSLVLGAAVVALAVLLAYKSSPQSRVAPDASAEAATPSTSAAPPSTISLGLDADTPLLFGDGGGLSLGDLPGFDDRGGDAATRLPDKAPRTVHFGVVLVTHQGAQGAPATARPKKEALDLATRLAADAKTDFSGAVRRGDSGSMSDAGRMPRGVLEPNVEFVLFTLPVGDVSEPLETPRGYWIVKRLD